MPHRPSPVHVRRFRRDDRDQLAALVNAHARAVVPGTTVSTQRVLAQLEREPGEFVVDPWVADRVTLVAEQRGRICAAALLLRYRDDDDVGATYRGTGELRWLLQWPVAPFWPDADAAGRALVTAAVELLRTAGVRAVLADPSLPAPGVYGVPEQWPHVADLLTGAGFRPGDRTEVVLMALVDAVPRTTAPSDVAISRRLGSAGVRLSAIAAGAELGYVEVDELAADAGHVAAGGGVADVGNLWAQPGQQHLLPWLLGEAADWLRLGHVQRLLAYVDEVDAQATDELALLTAAGFRELTRTRRGWRWHGAGTRVDPDHAAG